MADALSGRRVLVIEDESLVAMLLETILEDLGCTVIGPVSNIDDGLIAAQGTEGLDVGLLDVNVAGREVFPVAEALIARNIPVVFSTGYGESGLPPHWRGRPTIQKPFTENTIRDALIRAVTTPKS